MSEAEKVCAVIGLIIGLMIGAISGGYIRGERKNTKAVENGGAEYDSKTGEFKWINHNLKEDNE